jgi:FAD/FMN-containing dehydrogenase
VSGEDGWSGIRLEELERAIDGDVIVADTPAMDARPTPFNARYDQTRPRAVVRCASGGDVAEAISFVRRHGLDSATRSGGHCFAGRSATSGLLIDVSPMRSVSVADGEVRIGAGATLGEVYVGLLPHGLTIPGGTCPSVGIAGLTLGGGLGLLGRAHGLTSDNLVRARIVLADGRTIECDEHHDETLFWALRGAGTGHFGVVTELVFRPVPIPMLATTFELTWPFERAATVAEAWMAWSPFAPDELAASLVIAAGPEPEVEPTVQVLGTMLGTATDAREVLEGLVERAVSPASGDVREMPYADVLRHWGARAGERLEDPRATPAGRAAHFVKSEFFAGPLPAEAISALLARLSDGRARGQTRELDFSPWGGAYNRIRPEATAFVHRDPLFCLKHAAVVDAGSSATERAGCQRWAAASWGTVHTWGTGGVFPNFPDPDVEDWGRAYYGWNLERLLEVKAHYDPDTLFMFTQSLPPR